MKNYPNEIEKRQINLKNELLEAKKQLNQSLAELELARAKEKELDKLVFEIQKRHDIQIHRSNLQFQQINLSLNK